MNLPSREEREEAVNSLTTDARSYRNLAARAQHMEDAASFESHATMVDSIAAFLRADTIDRMAEAIRAADAVLHEHDSPRTHAPSSDLHAALNAYRAARAKLDLT